MKEIQGQIAEMTALNKETEKEMKCISEGTKTTITTTSYHTSFVEKGEIARDLRRHLSDHTITYSILVEALSKSQKSLEAIQHEIDKLHKDLVGIDKKATILSSDVKHHKETLVNLFDQVETYIRPLNSEASVYSPIVQILEAVKNSVEVGIALLASEDKKDVVFGTKHLLKQVTILSNYARSTRNFLQPCPRYNGLAANVT
ncbi:unnamed protein product [Rotaria socialis]|uniref:Uncharacterized protein n=1 Tax=Rotaria socialis TaxID=392032 RepID=A0A818FBZ6_9BILA|nr:unnamed protein product [Rotaria socialis]